MPSDAPSPESIRTWLTGIEDQLSAVHAQLQPLLVEQRRLESQQRLLVSLLKELDGGGATLKMEEAIADNVMNASKSLGGTGRYVIERAVEILREAGQPLHINDLHAKFIERGYQVPGAGTPANLTAHIRRSEAIASPKRGVYGLVDQVGVQATRRRRAKRRPTRRKRAGGATNPKR